MTEHALGTKTVATGRITNWPMIWASTALVVLLLAMGRPQGQDWNEPGFLVPAAVIVLAALVNVLTLSSLRTTAGPHGLAVHYGVLGWPRFRYPPQRIRSVTPTRVSASMWSWGILWTPRDGLRLTLRSGPAVELVLVNGRKVTVSVRDAEQVVGVLVAAGCATGPAERTVR